MMFMGLAAINSQANLLFGVFGLMIGILLVSGVVSRSVLRGLTLSRGLPETAIVGIPAIITYEIRNAKKFWPSLSATVAELDGVEAFRVQPQGYMLHAAPRMSAIIPAQVIPKRRGLHQLNRHQISTSFPFGFIKRAVERREPESILVYPAICDINPKLMQIMRSADSTGATMRPRRGGSDEIYGLKEFRQGESPRFIYWKRSARTGTLVSKEMTHVSPPKILLVVDTYIEPTKRSRRTHADVERVIAMAASLANRALEAGLSVGLVCWSGEWIKIPAGRGKRHRRDLLALLARLPLNAAGSREALMRESSTMQESSVTMALFTPEEFDPSPAARVQGASVVFPVRGGLTDRWFHFDPTIDFTHTMPVDQEPGVA